MPPKRQRAVSSRLASGSRYRSPMFGWRFQRGADRTLSTSSAGGDAGNLFAVSWNRGRNHARGSYSGFADWALFLGQGYIGGVVPVQTLLFLPVVVGYYVLLQRSVIGRALYAIGFGAAGARYAGIPV